MPDREFDLVLYGATGYVGRLTAEYLADAAPSSARIALAGRSAPKLAALQGDLGGPAAAWSTIVADASNEQALGQMAERTTAVATSVGPYLRYGLPLATACARAGTHYADLTGEPLFVRECIDRVHDEAVASGARIVNSCGFDSVPSDLSVLLLHQAAVDGRAGELTDTTLVAQLKGGFSGGTLDSMRAMMEAIAADPSRARVLAHPYSLSPDPSRDPNVGRQSDQAWEAASSIDPSLEGWVSTFVMAAHNTRIVRRSNGLLGWPYGERFRYREVMHAGRSRLSPVTAAAVSGGVAGAVAVMSVLSRSKLGRHLLDRVMPSPGTGPSQEARQAGWFRMRTFAATTSGTRLAATFGAQGDPGYKATSVMFGESALALAFDQLGDQAGVVTPAVAIGATLPDRLRDAGFTIDVTRRE